MITQKHVLKISETAYSTTHVIRNANETPFVDRDMKFVKMCGIIAITQRITLIIPKAREI